MILITGKFNFEQGYPYFFSATHDFDRWTYVGKVPERVRFEFKYGPENSDHVNYLVLPLDTTIRTAKDLCEAKADDGQDLMSDNDWIELWNPLTQQKVAPALSCYHIKNVPGYNFNIEPGQVYLITVQGNRTWTQR